jgi:hypothetical protein
VNVDLDTDIIIGSTGKGHATYKEVKVYVKENCGLNVPLHPQ